MSDGQPKRRRWFRYSLRTFLIVVTAICIWLGLQVNAARRQKEVVAAIDTGGGLVYFDYEMTLGTNSRSVVDPKASPPGPVWLREFLGEDYFRTAKGVSLGLPIRESCFAQVARLPELELLASFNTQIIDSASGTKRSVQDSDLAIIDGLTRLRYLAFHDWKGESRITDAGLIHIQNLTDLENLELTNTRVTDAAVQYLRRLTKLKYLDLQGTLVTADGIHELQKSLPNATIIGP
jgi:hypothetical protein